MDAIHQSLSSESVKYQNYNLRFGYRNTGKDGFDSFHTSYLETESTFSGKLNNKIFNT